MKILTVSAEINGILMVYTEGKHSWVFSAPREKDGLRVVYFDGKEKGPGALLGSVVPIQLGYITKSPNIEVGRCLGVRSPERPKSEGVSISNKITDIILLFGNVDEY